MDNEQTETEIVATPPELTEPTDPVVALTPTEVRLAIRRKQVAFLITRGYSFVDIAEACGVSDETIRRDVRAIRASFERDMGESSSVMGIAHTVMMRSKARERELWAIYEEARGVRLRDEQGKPLPGYEAGREPNLMARLQAAREMRANAEHEVKVLQSLGLVFRAPERMAVDMMLMAQLSALPEPMLDKLAITTDKDAFKQLMASYLGEEALPAYAKPAGTAVAVIEQPASAPTEPIAST